MDKVDKTEGYTFIGDQRYRKGGIIFIIIPLTFSILIYGTYYLFPNNSDFDIFASESICGTIGFTCVVVFLLIIGIIGLLKEQIKITISGNTFSFTPNALLYCSLKNPKPIIQIDNIQTIVSNVNYELAKDISESIRANKLYKLSKDNFLLKLPIFNRTSESSMIRIISDTFIIIDKDGNQYLINKDFRELEDIIRLLSEG